MIRHHLLVAAALAALSTPLPLAAQAIVQPLGNTDADALAAQMRLLAADPRNVQALAQAGELSLRLGDLSGAAALLARADKVDPRNGRVKAGMGSILVRSERPGEALRFFAQAESYGWPAARFAADRGLAFDLVGQQGRAQADYRLALQNGADDETTRRYALSLGISGNQPRALEQLDPLVRRQDRAAWRARAFVLAMTGDTPGAAKIATTMMPTGMAQGLAAFFQRLPSLSATDRAFAVHFGEINATPERLADARLAPPYAPIAPEPVAQPVQVAATVAATPADDRRNRRDRRSRRERERDRQQQAALAPVVAPQRPVALAAATPAPTPQPVAAAMRENNVRVVASAPPLVLASAYPPPAAARPIVASPLLQAARPVMLSPSTAAQPVVTPTGQPAATIAAVPVATPRPATVVPTSVPPIPTAVQVAAAPPSPTPITTTSVPASTSAPVVAQASAPVAPVQTQAATDRADSVLARIVANLSIPASELGVASARPDPGPVAIPPAVERAPASSTGRHVVAQASAQEGKDAALRRTVAARLAGDAKADEPAAGQRPRRGAATQLAEADAPATTRRGRRGAPVEIAAAEEPVSGRRTRRSAVSSDDVAADTPTTRTRGRKSAAAEDDSPLTPAQRRAADRKAAADKKAVAEKKELAEQAAADKKAARANPSRIWVQVAGGANEDDLGKAWSAAQAKTPALKSRAGYKTPLRATNRVLTGPFKTGAEARAFVNQLNKQGVSAFSFTSDAGQKVEKLGAQKTGK